MKRAKKPKCAECERLRTALLAERRSWDALWNDRTKAASELIDKGIMLDAVCKALEREQVEHSRWRRTALRSDLLITSMSVECAGLRGEVTKLDRERGRILGYGKPWWKLSIGNILARMRAR